MKEQHTYTHMMTLYTILFGPTHTHAVFKTWNHVTFNILFNSQDTSLYWDSTVILDFVIVTNSLSLVHCH